MNVSRYGVSRLESEIKELRSAVESINSQEHDCGVPLSMGQRWTVIGAIAAVVLSFTGFSGYAIVSHENQMSSEYANMNDPYNYSQPMPAPTLHEAPHDAPSANDQWIVCNGRMINFGPGLTEDEQAAVEKEVKKYC